MKNHHRVEANDKEKRRSPWSIGISAPPIRCACPMRSWVPHLVFTTRNSMKWYCSSLLAKLVYNVREPPPNTYKWDQAQFRGCLFWCLYIYNIHIYNIHIYIYIYIYICSHVHWPRCEPAHRSNLGCWRGAGEDPSTVDLTSAMFFLPVGIV